MESPRRQLKEEVAEILREFRGQGQLSYPLHIDEHAKLGQGTFGIVFRASTHADGTACAVKVTIDASGELQKEQRLMGKAVVSKSKYLLLPIFTHSIDKDRCIYVLPLMQVNLEAFRHTLRWTQNGAFTGCPWSILMRVILDCLTGLMHLHAMGLSHNDVKPANLMLDCDGDLRLGDFSLLDEATELDPKYIQTPWYRSPEHLIFMHKNRPKTHVAIDWLLLDQLSEEDLGECDKVIQKAIMHRRPPPPSGEYKVRLDPMLVPEESLIRSQWSCMEDGGSSIVYVLRHRDPRRDKEIVHVWRLKDVEMNGFAFVCHFKPLRCVEFKDFECGTDESGKYLCTGHVLHARPDVHPYTAMNKDGRWWIAEKVEEREVWPLMKMEHYDAAKGDVFAAGISVYELLSGSHCFPMKVWNPEGHLELMRMWDSRVHSVLVDNDIEITTRTGHIGDSIATTYKRYCARDEPLLGPWRAEDCAHQGHEGDTLENKAAKDRFREFLRWGVSMSTGGESPRVHELIVQVVKKMCDPCRRSRPTAGEALEYLHAEFDALEAAEQHDSHGIDSSNVEMVQ